MSEIKNKKNIIEKSNSSIAYFSMEIALESNIKTYSGGLGVLAGDILRSAADLKLPMLGVTLLSKYGYFDQKINKEGKQEAYPTKDYDFSKLKKLKTITNIKLGKDNVKIRTWLYEVKSPEGYIVPVYLLDTDVKGNKKEYRGLTDNLYFGDKDYRLLQDTILGRGGYAVLKKLGHDIKKFHINEGHGSFVAVAKFLDTKEKGIKKKIKEVKKACVFTTHTPVKIAHDIFSLEKVLAYQKDFPVNLPGFIKGKTVNMTEVGLYFSAYINSVSLSHKAVTEKMFPNYQINCVTNGVHSQTWTAPEFQKLYDKYLPNWRKSSLSLRNAFSVPKDEIWIAHQVAKRKLIKLIKENTKQKFSEKIFTIGFARRFTTYKRPTLLFNDIERLISIQKRVGEIQIVYSGKAHPKDDNGKQLLAEVNRISKSYKGKIKIAFMLGYEMDLAKIIISGVDVWLNTPLPPNEASGTSGMKAAHNGVPQLSTFDGWWREGYVKGKTGWTIEGDKIKTTGTRDEKDAASLYKLLEKDIIPLYYKKPEVWREIMRHTISVNASFFNTERVLLEYIKNAYI